MQTHTIGISVYLYKHLTRIVFLVRIILGIKLHGRWQPIAVAAKQGLNYFLEIMILFCSKSENYFDEKIYKEYDIEYVNEKFQYEDENGRYHWQVLKSYSKETFQRLQKANMLKKPIHQNIITINSIWMIAKLYDSAVYGKQMILHH